MWPPSLPAHWPVMCMSHSAAVVFLDLLVTKLKQQREKEELLEKAKRYKKISREGLAKEAFQVHTYFKSLSVSQAHRRFKLHACMMP